MTEYLVSGIINHRYGKDLMVLTNFRDTFEYITKNWSLWKVSWKMDNSFESHVFFIPRKNVNGKWIRRFVYEPTWLRNDFNFKFGITGISEEKKKEYLPKLVALSRSQFREFGTNPRYMAEVIALARQYFDNAVKRMNSIV